MAAARLLKAVLAQCHISSALRTQFLLVYIPVASEMVEQPRDEADVLHGVLDMQSPQRAFSSLVMREESRFALLIGTYNAMFGRTWTKPVESLDLGVQPAMILDLFSTAVGR